MDKQDFIANALKNDIAHDQVVGMWNAFCGEKNYPDDVIYTNLRSLADYLSDGPYSFAHRVYHGNVDSFYNNYFCLNGYGCVDSFNYPTDQYSPVDFGKLAEWLIENSHLYSEIEALIAKWEEDQEEEPEVAHFFGLYDGKVWAAGSNTEELEADFLKSRDELVSLYRLDHTPAFDDLIIQPKD